MLISASALAETYYFHNDHLGTPQVLTDKTQTVVWKREYDPIGKVTETVALVEQNLRFPGQYFDVETGLHYNYFRTYDPGTGRYITSDPIGLAGGVNTYSYSLANPVLLIDDYGLIVGEVDPVLWPYIKLLHTSQKGVELRRRVIENELVVNIHVGVNHCDTFANPNLDKAGNPTEWDVHVFTGVHNHLKLPGLLNGKFTHFTPSVTRNLAHELGLTTGAKDDGGSA